MDYQDISVNGFWINIDVQVGAQWTANNIFITSPKKYGIKIQNTINEDGGDWSIVNSNFNAGDYSADAAIRIESSGGGKINNIKINTGYPSTHNFVRGIHVDNSTAYRPDGPNGTIILYIANASIENYR